MVSGVHGLVSWGGADNDVVNAFLGIGGACSDQTSQ